MFTNTTRMTHLEGEAKNWSKKANKSGCSTDNTRVENYISLLVVMCQMWEWHLSLNFMLLCEWPQTIFMSLLCIYSGVWYNEPWYNEGILQRTVFINKIRMLQRTRRNIISRRITRVSMTCPAFLLWLECQSLSLLSFVRFIYQFSSVICLFLPFAVTIIFKLISYYFTLYYLFCIIFFLFKFLCQMVTLL